MINVVILVKDRPRLTRQCLQSMWANKGKADLSLVIVDDRSGKETRGIVLDFAKGKPGCLVFYPEDAESGCVGALRNHGIKVSEERFGRGDYLYLADNDGFYLLGWAEIQPLAFRYAEEKGFRLLGGYTHPFHRPNEEFLLPPIGGWPPFHIASHDAIMGISHLMRWKTYEEFGPFDANAKGTGQSEDFAFCQRIVKAGYKVGSLYPRVILNCGLLDSFGRPCVGYEEVKRELEEEIRKHNLAWKVHYETVETTAGRGSFRGETQ